LNPDSRAQVLEDSELLESVYRSAALQGDTEAPLNAEDEVDFHFVCFARSKSGVLYELDGDRKGPVPTNVVMKDDEDVLCKAGVRLIRRFMEKEGESGSFGLMALVEKFAGQYSAPD
jgi:ubiquitin carboxyl-terminal hydrolase L3